MAFVLTPLAVLPMAAFSRQLKKQGRRSQIKMAEIYNLIYETITGHRIVKAFTMEPFEMRKFLKASWRYFRINLKLAWISSLSSPFMEFIGGARRRLHPVRRHPSRISARAASAPAISAPSPWPSSLCSRPSSG